MISQTRGARSAGTSRRATCGMTVILVMAPQRAITGQGLDRKNVDSCRSEVPKIERRDQIRFDDMLAAAKIPMIAAPLGNALSVSAAIMPRVSRVSGNRFTTISLRARNAFSCSRPLKVSISSLRRDWRTQPATLKPAKSARHGRRPIAPDHHANLAFGSGLIGILILALQLGVQIVGHLTVMA